MDDAFPDWAALLAAGARDPGSPFRNLALGTMGLEHTPQVRTVVLRRFDGRTLDIHTDTRSAKHAELRANPAATLHGWDQAGRIQIRANGRVTLHTMDAESATAWSLLRPASRATYHVQPGPGTPLPGPANPTPDTDEAAALRVFCVVRLTLHTLDHLHLAQGSHRRARFTWAADRIEAMWLVP